MEFSRETVKQLRRLIVFAAAVLLLAANWKSVLFGLSYVLSLLSPFITGFVIAFVLNLPMRAIEKRLFRIKRTALRRATSLLLSILSVLLALIFIVMFVTPQIWASLRTLSERIPPFAESMRASLEGYLERNPELSAVFRLENLRLDWDSIYAEAQGFLSRGVGSFLSGSVNAVKGIAGALGSFGIGFIFAVYLLLGKEELLRQVSHLLEAFLPERRYRLLRYTAALAEKKFSGFITGQCLEACILGAMFVLTLSLFRLPYAVLIGVLIAFTALIPVFGAFIGLFVGTFLMLIQSPQEALLFIVLFFVLQQIEGNLIYPHVVGNSVELPAIWVLAAVTVGGAMFGIAGMIVFIPLVSVFYALLREKVRRKLQASKRV